MNYIIRKVRKMLLALFIGFVGGVVSVLFLLVANKETRARSLARVMTGLHLGKYVPVAQERAENWAQKAQQLVTGQEPASNMPQSARSIVEQVLPEVMEGSNLPGRTGVIHDAFNGAMYDMSTLYGQHPLEVYGKLMDVVRAIAIGLSDDQLEVLTKNINDFMSELIKSETK
jgi:hypothetical protein